MLWISSSNSVSNTHYDRSQNVNIGIQGTKQWSLWDPSDHIKFGIAPYLSLRYQQIQHSNLRFENSIDLRVSRGEALYIPPFFAHQVTSPDVAVSLSLLFPSHVEERFANAYFRVQIFLEKWNRQEKLVALFTFLEILIKTLRISLPLDDEVNDSSSLSFLRNSEAFIFHYVVLLRYQGFKPLRKHNNDMLNCEWISSRMRDENALSHFRDTAREFATRMWGLGRSDLCGGDVALDSNIVWLSVANLVEELVLFAVDNDIDALVSIFTDCPFDGSKL